MFDAVGNEVVDELTAPPAGVLVARTDEVDEDVAEVSGMLVGDEVVTEEEATTPMVVKTVGVSGVGQIESACGLSTCVAPHSVRCLSIGIGCALTKKKQHVFLSCTIVRQHVDTVEQDISGALTQAHAIPTRDIVVQRADAETRAGGASPGGIGA